MTSFLVLDTAGLVLIAPSLVAGDLLDGDLDAPEADWISTAVIGGVVAAFGFAAAAAEAPLLARCSWARSRASSSGWVAWWPARLVKPAVLLGVCRFIKVCR